MNAGNLSDLVVFELKTETENAQGQIVPTWGEGFSAWCEVTRTSETTARFMTHFRDGVTPATHRLLWDGCIWSITNAVHDRKRASLFIDSDFSALIEVTHLQSTVREYIDGLPILRPRE